MSDSPASILYGIISDVVQRITAVTVGSEHLIRVANSLYDQATGTFVGTLLDGSVRRLQTAAKVLNSGGSQIDPATQGTLADIDTVLDSIKDTDGVKKITDQLPAGTNEIGKVAQGTRAAASAGWPEYLVDSTGNIVGVVLDGALYRLQTDSKIAVCPEGNLVHLDSIGCGTGVGRLKATLYSNDGDPVAFPSTSSSIKNGFVLNGASSNLLVDGSVTPVEFTYTADTTYDISIQEIKFTLVSNSVTFGNNYFGATSGPLANGLLVNAVVHDGDAVELYNIKQNEGFVNFASPGGFEWVVSSKDMMASSYIVGGGLQLVHGTSDHIKITVRDDIDSAGVYFKCYIKGNLVAAG